MSGPSDRASAPELGRAHSIRQSGLVLPLAVLVLSGAVVALAALVASTVYADWVEERARESEFGLHERWEVLVEWKLSTEARLEAANEQIRSFQVQIEQLRERERLLRQVLSVARERGIDPSVEQETGASSISELEQQIDEAVSEFGRLQASLAEATEERQVLVATLDQAEEQLSMMSSGGESGADAAPPPESTDAAVGDAPVRSSSQPPSLQRTIAQLREQARQEQRIVSILQERYRLTILDFLEGDLAGAERGLEGIRSYLGKPNVAGTLAIVERRSLDALVSGLLEQAIRDRRLLDDRLVETTAGEAARSARTLRDAASSAAALLDGGEPARALGMLESELETHPDVAEVTRLVERARAGVRAETARELLAEARVAAGRGELDLAVGRLEAVAALFAEPDRRQVASVVETLEEAARVRLNSDRVAWAQRVADAEAATARVEQALALERGRTGELTSHLAGVDTALTEIASYLERVAADPLATRAAPADLASGTGALPDRYPPVSELARAALESASEASASTARREAIGETISDLGLAVGYLDGSLDVDRELVIDRLEQNIRVRPLALDIQELARNGVAREELPLGQLRFLGVVGLAGVTRVTVDLLTDTPVAEGDTVVFTRRVDGEERRIGLATVLLVEGERLRVDVDELESGAEVRPQDLAYVRVE